MRLVGTLCISVMLAMPLIITAAPAPDPVGRDTCKSDSDCTDNAVSGKGYYCHIPEDASAGTCIGKGTISGETGEPGDEDEGEEGGEDENEDEDEEEEEDNAPVGRDTCKSDSDCTDNAVSGKGYYCHIPEDASAGTCI
ncbi:hypothetical protein BJ684DRAFT_15852, partial [Piptocephalis cylindrospora]